jgi:hypothetical protein
MKPQPRFDASVVHALYLKQRGDASRSVDILQRIVLQETPHINAIFLLGKIYLKQWKISEANAGLDREADPKNRGLFRL